MLKETIIRAVIEAGKLAKEHQNKIQKISYKEQHEIVTEMDVKCEELIKKILKEEFPNYNYYGEEEGKENTNSEYTFFIDPIDGTQNYVNGHNRYNSIVTLVKNGKPIAGAIYIPMKDELYYAEEGKGAVLNNKPLKVSNKKETFIISTKVDIEGGLREGPIGYIVGLLVKGERDGYIKAFKKNQTPVEGPAVYLFVTEAGGKVTDFYNKPWNVEERNIIVSNGIFHEELLSTLRKSSEK